MSRPTTFTFDISGTLPREKPDTINLFTTPEMNRTKGTFLVSLILLILSLIYSNITNFNTFDIIIVAFLFVFTVVIAVTGFMNYDIYNYIPIPGLDKLFASTPRVDMGKAKDENEMKAGANHLPIPP